MQSLFFRKGYYDACATFKVATDMPLEGVEASEEELVQSPEDVQEDAGIPEGAPAEELADVLGDLGTELGAEPLDPLEEESPVTWSDPVGLNSGDAMDRKVDANFGLEAYSGV